LCWRRRRSGDGGALNGRIIADGRAALNGLRLTREIAYEGIVQSNPKSFSPGRNPIAARVFSIDDCEWGAHFRRRRFQRLRQLGCAGEGCAAVSRAMRCRRRLQVPECKPRRPNQAKAAQAGDGGRWFERVRFYPSTNGFVSSTSCPEEQASLHHHCLTWFAPPAIRCDDARQHNHGEGLVIPRFFKKSRKSFCKVRGCVRRNKFR
jgi:hypothetical protein